MKEIIKHLVCLQEYITHKKWRQHICYRLNYGMAMLLTGIVLFPNGFRITSGEPEHLRNQARRIFHSPVDSKSL